MTSEKKEKELENKVRNLEDQILKAKNAAKELKENIDKSVIVNNEMRNQANELLETLN